jgi:hypothetical protein
MADRMRAEAHVGRQQHSDLAAKGATPAAPKNNPSGG